MTGTRTAHLVPKKPLSKRGSPGYSAPREDMLKSFSHTFTHQAPVPTKARLPSCLCQPHLSWSRQAGWGLWAVRPRRAGGEEEGGAWPAALRRGLEVKGTSLYLTWALTNRLTSSVPGAKSEGRSVLLTPGQQVGAFTLQGEKRKPSPFSQPLSPVFLLSWGSE